MGDFRHGHDDHRRDGCFEDGPPHCKALSDRDDIETTDFNARSIHDVAVGVVESPAGGTSVVSGLVAAFAASFLLVNRSQLPATLQAAQGANPLFLGAAAAVGMLYLLNYAAMYRAAYRAVGLTIPLGVAFRTANAAHVLNMTIVNSGGLAGLAPFLSDAKARGQGRGQVVSAYLLVTFLGHLVFALVLAVVLRNTGRHFDAWH